MDFFKLCLRPLLQGTLYLQCQTVPYTMKLAGSIFIWIYTAFAVLRYPSRVLLCCLSNPERGTSNLESSSILFLGQKTIFADTLSPQVLRSISRDQEGDWKAMQTPMAELYADPKPLGTWGCVLELSPEKTTAMFAYPISFESSMNER